MNTRGEMEKVDPSSSTNRVPTVEEQRDPPSDPIKRFNRPEQGLSCGHDETAVRGPLHRLSVQPDWPRRETGELLWRCRRIRRGCGSADRIHGDQAARVEADDGEVPELNDVPDGRPTIRSATSTGASSIAWLIGIPGAIFRGLCILLPPARPRRQGVDPQCKLMHLGQHLYRGHLSTLPKACGSRAGGRCNA